MEKLTAPSFILVVNAGSSSLKTSLYHICSRGDSQSDSFCRLAANAHAKNIGTDQGQIDLEVQGAAPLKSEFFAAKDNLPIPKIFEAWAAEPLLKFMPEQIAAVGHRIVHGGENTQSQRLTPGLIAEIEQLSSLAPLHNPPSIAGLKAVMAAVGKSVPHFAVFDTAFHRTLPPKASTYGIPSELAEKFSIKRYGFHGIAHQSLWQLYEGIAKSSNSKKAITLQLGSGCSMAAIFDGRSRDTTMGFTPGEGLLMATRAGDLDSGVVAYLCAKMEKSAQDILHLLNSDSGLLGVSSASSEMKALCRLIDQPRAQLAIELFCYRIIKYIAAYTAVLEGLDALIFSGGIGENAASVRGKIIQGMQWSGYQIDERLNAEAVGLQPGEIKKISTLSSSVEIYVAGSNENAFIANEVLGMVQIS